MEIKIIDAAFAGLFHDIGKVLQRSRPDGRSLPDGIEKEGQPAHAVWTQKFSDEIGIKNSLYKSALHSVYHHRPEKSPSEDHKLSLLIAVADKLSAGERSEESPDHSGQLPKQMLSIFDRLGNFRGKKEKQNDFLPLKEISLEKRAIFPSQKTDPSSEISYEKISSGLKETLHNFCGDEETDLEQFLSALQQQTWSIPSSFYYNLPDVSLYDHARTTAAIAVCLKDKSEAELSEIEKALLAEFANVNEMTEKQKALLQEPAAMLIGGDISGIQNFIYTVSWNMAAKSLRGRSFYLQVLNESVLRFVLRKLDIPYTNVIYSGGGHFYLIAPLSAKNKLDEIQRQITQRLLQHHGISLYLSLSAVVIPYEGFKRGRFTQYWNAMHQKLAYKKQQRYLELGKDMFDQLFQPENHGGNKENVCSVCGMEKTGVKLIDDENNIEGEEKYICPTCSSFAEDLGSILPQAHYVRLILGEPEDHESGKFGDVLTSFGVGFELLDKNGNILGLSQTLKSGKRDVLWEMDDPVKNINFSKFLRPSVIWRHYLVNRIPHKDNSSEPMTFDEIQNTASEGIKRLGVLRMDVDDLGTLFTNGFGSGPDSIATISRLSTMSFQLSLFFEGYLKKICDETGDPIYAVYSGGDDLFLIGPWQMMPILAQRIQKDFSEYACWNSDFHISGGMTFIHGKYPLIQAAKDAGYALDQAKNLDGKNAFSFLDEAWKWDDFSKLTDFKNNLENIVDTMKGPNSLLQMLQQLDDQRQHSDRKTYGRWLWLGDYQFTRMGEQYRQNKELRSELISIHETIRNSYYSDLHLWAKAARWAQLELRSVSSITEAGD